MTAGEQDPPGARSARAGRAGLCARVALVALLVLLAIEAALGLRAESGRALAVPLAARTLALGDDADWRYRATLGDDVGLLVELRAHARPDSIVIFLHDGSVEAMRPMLQITELLYPLTVRQVELPPGGLPQPPPVQGDVLLAVLRPGAALAAQLGRSGWHELRGETPGRLWSAREPAPVAAPAPLPGNDPLTTTRLPGWRLLLLVALPLLSGALLLRALSFRPRDEPLAFWGWAWMTGCVWIGAVLFAWMLLGQSPRALGPPAWIELAAGLPALLALLALRRRDRPGAEAGACASPAGVPARATRGPAERLLFAACLVLALASAADHLVLASGRVIAGGDESTIWTAKARALWDSDGFTDRYAALAARHFPWHQDYPPLNPLLLLFADGLAGRSLDFESRVPVQLFMPALLLVLAGALRRAARPAVAGLLLLAFATCRTTTDAAWVALSDPFVAGGLVVLLESLRRWREEGRSRWLALASMAATLLVFSKNEGLMLLLAALASCVFGVVANAALARRRRTAGDGGAECSVPPPSPAPRLRPSHLAWLLPPLAVLVAHAWINHRFGLVNDLFASEDGSGFAGRLLHQAADNAGSVLRSLAATLADPRETALLLAAFALLILAFPRRMLLPRADAPVQPDRSAGSRTVLLGMAAFVLVYLATPHDLAWHLRWSLPRLLFQLLPLAVVSLGAAASWLSRGEAGGSGVKLRGPLR